MGESIRVLHVDDQPAVATMTADLLERAHDRIEVVVEHSGRSGIDRLSGEDPSIDCVVSDFDMPEMDGLDFLEEVRSYHTDLPFILFTGMGSDRLERVALDRGATAYFEKGTDPRKFERMADRIDRAVEAYRAEQ